MKHISILALKDSTINSIDGTVQLFTRVNDFLKYKGQKPFYKIEVVGITKDTILNNGLYTINADKLLENVKKTDLIVIPITCNDFTKTIKANEAFSSWIIKQYKMGAEVASLCVGTFFLASTGLLDGKKCATHWAVTNDFKRMFPNVKLADDKIITDENGIYTSGGNYSYLNLLLYLIEKNLGREMSVFASKMFEIDIERKNQTQFAIFMGQKQHGDEAVVTVQEYIEQNFQDKLSVDDLCIKYSVNRRTFERRFKKSTGNSILEYIQRVRIEAAKRQLEAGRKTINEIIYEVGYLDADAFRNIFRKYTGLSPIDYLNKYKL